MTPGCFRSSTLCVVLLVLLQLVWQTYGEQCMWKSLAGATFDLRPLRVTNEQAFSYHIIDGDLPCTSELEPTYSFAWNFCDDVTQASEPTFATGGNICRNDQRGAAIQYLNRTSDGYKECHVIGRYDPSNENSEFNLLVAHNPAAGVSMTYPKGEKCPNGVLRSATVDVQCANVRVEIDSALEPSKCQYHMVMKSWYGCPTECPVTASGLCSSHGHCYYDSTLKLPYCYCNEGFTGDACESAVTEVMQSSYYYKLQVFLLVVLLLAAVGLILIVFHMAKRVRQYRAEAAWSYGGLNSGSEHELSFAPQDMEMTQNF
jgi:hypothetical protein